MSNMTLPNGLPQGSDAAREFLSTLTTNAQGHLVLFSANSGNRRVDSFSVDNIDAAVSQAIALSSTHNVYFGLGLQAEAPENGSRGKADDVASITALWVEIDIAGPGHKTEALPPDFESAKTLLDALPLPPSITVHSGGGIHCYWLFTEPQMLKSKEDRDEVHKLNLRLQATIRQEAEKNGWKIDPTADLARVLRVPGTANHKSSPPRPVHILGWNPERKYTVQDFDQNTIELKSLIKPKRVARQRAQSDEGHFKPESDFPPANAQAIMEECAWFAALVRNASQLAEPEWFEQIVILSKCEDGEKLAHEHSKGYDGYDETETAEKFRHASTYTPMTCQSIQMSFGSDCCDGCIFADRIKAPIQLGDTRPAHKAMLTFWKALPAIQQEPSMVYEDETLEILSVIEKEKPATYAKIIDIFKKMGITMGAYKQAMMNYLQKKIIQSGGPYHIENNTLIWDKWTASGFSNTPLANFASKIVLEITKDDGLNLEKFFRIEGSLATGEPLTGIEVPATEFGSLNWIIAQYGACAVVYPQTQSHVKAAIQVCSGKYDKKSVFGHAGWKKIDNDYFFLTASGAMNGAGLHEHVEVDLGQKVLNEYALAPAPTGPDLVTAIKASLRLLDMAPAYITYVVLGAIYRAPLGEAAQVDLSLFIYGLTGTRKSELAAIAQRHFGSGFHGKNLPANWSSTANALEKVAFIAKDSILVVDDFIPKGSQYDISADHKKAERVLRAQGNNAGRGRMTATGGLNTTYYPRGLILATGEDIPRGQSLRARLMILEMGVTDIDLDVLTEMQATAENHLLVQAMSAYITWLAPQMDLLKATLPQQAIDYRSKAMEFEATHGRTPSMVANLMLGLEQFALFAESMGVMTASDKEDFLVNAWKNLCDAARRQAKYQTSECPVTMYLHLLGSALQAGKCHLQSNTGGSPAKPDQWGWAADPNDPTGLQWKPRGDHVGWVVGGDIYLTSAAAYAVAQSMAQRQGIALNVGEKTLNKHLQEKGKLKTVRMKPKSQEVLGYTVQKQINGSKKNVLHMNANEFEHDEKQ